MTLLICIRIFCVWRLIFELDQTFIWNVSISPWQIFDKLCQSFGGDVLQVLFNSAEGVASCAPENMAFELMRFILDQTIAVVAFNILFFWKIVKFLCYKLLGSQPQANLQFYRGCLKGQSLYSYFYAFDHEFFNAQKTVDRFQVPPLHTCGAHFW